MGFNPSEEKKELNCFIPSSWVHVIIAEPTQKGGATSTCLLSLCFQIVLLFILKKVLRYKPGGDGSHSNPV